MTPGVVKAALEHVRPARLVVIVAVALVVAPLLVAETPPLVDLPGFGEQLVHFRDVLAGDAVARAEYRVNWATPYLGAYLLGWLLSLAMPVSWALRVLICSSVLAFTILVDRVRIEQDAPQIWTLVGPVAAVGYSFRWGFVSYMLAVPVATWAILVAVRFVERPSARRGVALAALGLALLVTHALALAFVCALVGLMIVCVSASLRGALRLFVPLAPGLTVAGAWVVWNALKVPGAATATTWGLGAHRIWEVPAAIVSNEVAPWTLLAGGLTLAFPFIAGGRWDDRRWRRAPLVAAVGIVLLAPRDAVGTYALAARIAPLLPVCLLIALRAGEMRRPQAVAAVGATCLLVAWQGLVGFEIVAFDREARDFAAVAQAIPSGQRVLSIVTRTQSAHAPGPVYLHFASWYVVWRGGRVDPSFAAGYHQPVQYRTPPALPVSFEWQPYLTLRGELARDYGYIVAHSTPDPRSTVFLASDLEVGLLQRSGPFWLFRNATSPSGVRR